MTVPDGKETRTHNLAIFAPLFILHLPYFDFSSKAHASSDAPIFACEEVMTAELVCFIECLRERKVGARSRMDLDR